MTQQREWTQDEIDQEMARCDDSWAPGPQSQTMTEEEIDELLIKATERFCHRTSYDVRRDAPICDWKKCPRKVGMDCYLRVPADGEIGGGK